MATYNATNDFAGIDPATPAGNEAASMLDDSIRELKLVAKNVVTKGHKSTGEHIHALIAENALIGAFATPSIAGVYTHDRFAVISDPYSIVSTGLANYSFKLPAGKYKMRVITCFNKTGLSSSNITVYHHDTSTNNFYNGTVVNAASSTTFTIFSEIAAILDVKATDDLSITSAFTTANTVDGFGVAVTNGNILGAYHSVWEIEKIA